MLIDLEKIENLLDGYGLATIESERDLADTFSWEEDITIEVSMPLSTLVWCFDEMGQFIGVGCSKSGEFTAQARAYWAK
jgi:hypothetical protein